MNNNIMKANADSFVYRHANGIKLASSNCLNACSGAVFNRQPLISMDELMDMPFNVFFVDPEHYPLILNDMSWQTSGFNSCKEALGVRAEDLCDDKKQVMEIYANDDLIMKEKNLNIFDEQSELLTHNSIHALSIKMPWYGEDNELKGVFGCAIMLDYFKPDNIADQLSLISNTFMAKILPSQNILPGKSIDGVYFSKREMEIIRLVIRGRTMREAAVILNLSRRTVENYFITIRNKMNVSSKSEFIDKVIDYFI